MKSLIVLFALVLTTFISTSSQAQNAVAPNVQIIQTTDEVAMPAQTVNSSESVDAVQSGQAAPAANVRIIEGRKVMVDSQGIQSLAVPATDPAANPAPNDPLKKPE